MADMQRDDTIRTSRKNKRDVFGNILAHDKDGQNLINEQTDNIFRDTVKSKKDIVQSKINETNNIVGGTNDFSHIGRMEEKIRELINYLRTSDSIEEYRDGLSLLRDQINERLPRDSEMTDTSGSGFGWRTAAVEVAREEKAKAIEGREKWKLSNNRKRRGQSPVEFVSRVYPDRRQIGLTLADIRHADPSLYMALAQWKLRHSSDPALRALELPTLKESNDRLLAEQGAPTNAEVYALIRSNDPMASEAYRLRTVVVSRERMKAQKRFDIK